MAGSRHANQDIGAQREHQVDARIGARADPGRPCGQRLAVDVLHHEERTPVVGDATVEQARDVRMHQPGQYLALVPQLIAGGLAREVADQFDRDLLLELLVDPCGQEHQPHAATAEFAFEPIAPGMSRNPN